MSPRAAAAVALLMCSAALGVAVVGTTPWHPLPRARGAAVTVDPALDFTRAERQHEEAFHRALRPPSYAGLVVGLLVSAALGLTSLGARIVTAIGSRTGERWWLAAPLGAFAVVGIVRVATLPFSARAETVLRRFDLSTQTWASWAADVAKSFGISAVVAAIALLMLLGLARAFPRHWWLPLGVAGGVLVIVMTFAFPVIVEPLFNRFTPMPDSPLKTSLLELARTDGLRVHDVLVADASRRTTAANAYVSGLGSSRRIVVYDTLLRGASDEEVRLVVAHELGHVKRRDVAHGAALGAIAVAALACALAVALTWRPLLRYAGTTGPTDPRVVPLVLFLVTAAVAVSGPLQCLVSRRVEARADVHALDLTRDPEVFVSAERRLALTNLAALRPNPVIYALFYTHPTSPERIALARQWAITHGVAVPAPRVAPP
ncbi:MAG: M48 family metallopeptidase [Frankia sp.]|nr:M48 family metallopeptidase [Frankia sp.]